MLRPSGLKSTVTLLMAALMLVLSLAPAAALNRSAIPGELRWVYASGSATGGKAITVRVTIWGEAPAGGTVVALKTNNPAVVLPKTVTVPAGKSEVIVKGKTLAVTENQRVTISASYNGRVRSRTMTVLRPYLSSTTVQTRIKSGGLGKVIVRLSGIAPEGGVVVYVGSNRPGVLPMPAVVIVPAGKASASINVQARVLKADVNVNVTALYRGIRITKPTIVRKARPEAPTPTATATATIEATVQTSATTTADQTATFEADMTATQIAGDATATSAADDATATSEADDRSSADTTATSEAAATMTAISDAATATRAADEATGTAQAEASATQAAEDATATQAANNAAADATATQAASDATATQAARDADATATQEAILTATASAPTATSTSTPLPATYSVTITTSATEVPKGGSVFVTLCLNEIPQVPVALWWTATDAKFDDPTNTGSAVIPAGASGPGACVEVIFNGWNRGYGEPTGVGTLTFTLDNGQTFESPEVLFKGK